MGCPFKQGSGLHPRLRIGAVLLAAGAGRRMGGVAKPLIRLQGVPLVRRHLVALSGAGVDEVVVVTGHAREAVEAEVRPFTVTLAHNAAPEEGEAASVRAGLAALGGAFDAVLVVPADLPLLAGADLTELVGAFKKRPGGHVVVPVFEGRRGDPVVLDEVAQARVLEGTLSLDDVLDREPALVHRHETANTRFMSGLDTLEDVRAMAERTGWRLELPATA
ncbi:MAG TPA: nucleotidyltransferase family protein [Albitalea sp.]